MEICNFIGIGLTTCPVISAENKSREKREKRMEYINFSLTSYVGVGLIRSVPVVIIRHVVVSVVSYFLVKVAF